MYEMNIKSSTKIQIIIESFILFNVKILSTTYVHMYNKNYTGTINYTRRLISFI